MKYCIVCGKTASFNLKGEPPKYCAEHKDSLTMINVKNKTCLTDCCNKLANFNYINEKKPLYCFEHIIDNKMVNITSKRCIIDNCNRYLR